MCQQGNYLMSVAAVLSVFADGFLLCCRGGKGQMVPVLHHTSLMSPGGRALFFFFLTHCLFKNVCVHSSNLEKASDWSGLGHMFLQGQLL